MSAKPKPFPLPILIDLLRERIEVANQYEKRARIGCLGELIEQAVGHLERLRAIDGTPRPIVIVPEPADFPSGSRWGVWGDLVAAFRDNWRRRRAERNDTRDLQGEALVNELGRMAR